MDSSITESSGSTVSFGTGIVQQTSKDLTHSIHTSISLIVGDFYIVDLYGSPLGSFLNAGSALNQGNLNTCDTSKYSYCIAMEDIRWVVWKLSAALASSTA